MRLALRSMAGARRGAEPREDDEPEHQRQQQAETETESVCVTQTTSPAAGTSPTDGSTIASPALIRALPPASCGMSLGLCGGASVCLELRRAVASFSWLSGCLKVSATVQLTAAAVILSLFFVRMVCHPRQVWRELRQPGLCSAYGTLEMAALFVTAGLIAPNSVTVVCIAT